MNRLTLVLTTTVLAAACDRPRELEVRTFPIEHISADVASAIVDPYVWRERPGAPGALSVIDGVLTVRETAANLAEIEGVLTDFDRARADVRLHFQLIEANGPTASDPRIAEVEAELRRVLRFDGYRLVGEALVAVTDRSEISQDLRAAGASYLIDSGVTWVSPGLIRLSEVTLWELGGRPILRTTVTVRPGQTLVLGTSPGEGNAATLLLTVTAEEVGAPA